MIEVFKNISSIYKDKITTNILTVRLNDAAKQCVYNYKLYNTGYGNNVTSSGTRKPNCH